MKQAGAAQFLGAAARFHVVVHADDVGQIRLFRVADLLRAQLQQEVGQLFESRVHLGLLEGCYGGSTRDRTTGAYRHRRVQTSTRFPMPRRQAGPRGLLCSITTEWRPLCFDYSLPLSSFGV